MRDRERSATSLMSFCNTRARSSRRCSSPIIIGLRPGYGIWNSTQTTVILAHPYPSDHYRVLNIIKSHTATVLPDSVYVKYPSAQASSGLRRSRKSIRISGSNSWRRYNATTTPVALGHATGLAGEEEAVGRYFEVQVSENVQNGTSDIIAQAWFKLYYTAADLDRTGDGDANDPGDINESTLVLYVFDESTDRWTELSKEFAWVNETGVDTTNEELYGTSYEGHVWAIVSHFSLFALAGEPISGAVIPGERARVVRLVTRILMDGVTSRSCSWGPIPMIRMTIRVNWLLHRRQPHRQP